MRTSSARPPSWRGAAVLATVAVGATALVVGGGTAATATPAASSAPGDERALADRYAPVVRLVEQPVACGPGESFVPTDVEALFGDDGVALRGPWTTDDMVRIGPSAEDLGQGLAGYHLDFPGDPLDPGCTYEQWSDAITAGGRPTTYARVVTEEGRGGLALQYWLYYPFNDFNNKHESDWEMIQLEFAASDAAGALAQEPTRVGYTQHEGVELAEWGDIKLEVVDGTHPVVHPAAGSHANYFDAALFLGRSGQQGFGCDDTRGEPVDLRPDVALVPSDPAAVAGEFPWLGFTGRWGQREASFYNGPTGPNTKEQWTAPLSWTDTEGAPFSYAVPASGLYGTQATSAFCGVVASGSDALRRAISNPARAVLLLVGAVAVVAWLVRRTTWRPSAPLRLARRRSTGQVLSSVWRMYLRRLSLFIGIGVPIAVTTILPGVAHTWLTSWSEAAGGVSTASGVLVIVGGLLLAALAPVTLVLGQAAVVFAVREIDAERPVGVVGAYAGALRRGWQVLLTVLLLATVVVACLLTVVLTPVGIVVLVAGLLLLPVVVLEGVWGWTAYRRSAHLVRPRWVKVVVLVALTTGAALAIGPLLGTTLILGTSLPFAVSNAVSGIVYALLVPLVALAYVYVYADAVVSDEIEPPPERNVDLPAEATLP